MLITYLRFPISIKPPFTFKNGGRHSITDARLTLYQVFVFNTTFFDKKINKLDSMNYVQMKKIVRFYI